MSRTIRNDSLYAKRKRTDRSKLSKNYRAFKRGVEGQVSKWKERPALLAIETQSDTQILTMQSKVAA